MAFLEMGIKALADRTGNGLSPTALKRVEFFCKPEVLASFGALGTLMLFLSFNGPTSVLAHVMGNIDMLAAVLVMAMMFQSLQLGRFVNKLMAWVQRRSGGNEATFNFIAMILIGFASSLLSEVAVAAAVTGSVALVNMNQSRKAKEQILVLEASAVGVGGGLTNFAAPSIVIAANAFGWSTLETAMYLGPAVLVSLLIVAFEAKKVSANCEDSVKIENQPLRGIDFVNLVLWAGVLWFGVFSDPRSIVGMLVMLVISLAINLFYAVKFEKLTPADESAEEATGAEHSHNPILHLMEQAWESALVFAFLFSLMFMGDLIADAIKMFGEQLPTDPMGRSIALFWTSDIFSGWADNALAVFQLAPISYTTGEQIGTAWGSLTGGVMTLIGNAPNIVVWLIFIKAGVRLSFVGWIRRVFPVAVKLALFGAFYTAAVVWIFG
ncbi:DUF1646 family protein [Candidatus Peregrinibacteria bacterium]|jgi:Na+/H+ antiporter NhaD/arsenite permease-like protein|nr:DUF1646 family protein [Candidatus Peregrinibacteria bacterium]